MGLDMLREDHRNIVYCSGVNPHSLGEQQLLALETELQKERVVGMKIYLGYYPYYAYAKYMILFMNLRHLTMFRLCFIAVIRIQKEGC